MQITDIKIEVVERQPPTLAVKGDLAPSTQPLRQGVLRVMTDDGIEGNCFIGEYWEHAEPNFAPILEVLKPALVGKDPSIREWLWQQVQYLTTRFKVTEKNWAPVDIALWDIAGKAAQLPVYKLLGEYRDKVDSYATFPTFYAEPDGFVEEAREVVSRGYRAYKIHPGRLSTKDVIRMVTAVRAAVGNDFVLMLDPNCGYDYRNALEIGYSLDEQGFFWFEDPVPHHDIDAITELSRRLRTPLCMTDNSPRQLFDSADYIRRKAVRLVRGTSLRLGITGLIKLCNLAEAFGTNCEVGTAGNPLTNAANLHVLLAVKNCDYYEDLRNPQEPFGLQSYIEPQAGWVHAPTAPGLGFELDWDWIEHHRVATLTE